jgi:hypothetical protein
MKLLIVEDDSLIVYPARQFPSEMRTAAAELSTPGGAGDEDLTFRVTETMVGRPTQPRTMMRLVSFCDLVDPHPGFRVEY